MAMMGPRQRREPKLFYSEFNLDSRVPANHVLRRVAAAVDFDFVRSRVKALYGINGHPSIDPAVALKLMFLLFFEKVSSERALLAQLPMRLDWLWFCGYDLDDNLPDHSVLSKVRRRWGQAIFEEFFQRILGQCLEAGLVDASVVHVDSSLISADASKDRLEVHLRYVSRQMYEHLDEAEGSSGRTEAPVASESSASWKVEGSPRFGQRTTPVDPDARLACKYNQTTLGYKDHRVVDDRCGIVTATVTTPANVNDEKMLARLIEEHATNTEASAQTVVADKAYGIGENYRYLHDNDITPCIPHKAKNCNRDSDLSNTRFAYDAASDTFRCPTGKTLERREVQANKNAVIYEASRESCEVCIHFSRCVSSKTRGRRISRNLNEPYIEWADGVLSVAARKRLMARRKAKMEGSFADAAHRHGFKRARWRGLMRVSVQNLLIATMQNLRKLLRAVFGNWRPSARKERFTSIVAFVLSKEVFADGMKKTSPDEMAFLLRPL
jgi:transposase